MDSSSHIAMAMAMASSRTGRLDAESEMYCSSSH